MSFGAVQGAAYFSRMEDCLLPTGPEASHSLRLTTIWVRILDRGDHSVEWSAMDPLGTAASLIAVIKVASTVVEHIKSAAGAAKARKKLRDEVRACQFVLQELLDESSDVDAEDNWKETITALEAPRAPLGRLLIALQSVKEKLQPEGSLERGKEGVIKKTLSCLSWPFTEKEIQQILHTIEREKSLLTLALENDCRKLIRQVDKTAKDNQKLLLDLVDLVYEGTKETKAQSLQLTDVLERVHLSQSDVQHNLKQLQKLEENQEAAGFRDSVLEWLTPVDYTSQQSDFINQREPGTGQWLLNSPEFKAWLEADKHTLFCPGIPGAGKTVLTSVAINELTSLFGQDKAITIAFIYCNFRRQDEQTVRDLLSSLLRQIAQRNHAHPAVSEALKFLHDKFMEKQTQPSVDALTKALQSIVPAYSRVLILIDALDECQTADGCRWKFISELLALQKNKGVSVFVTSRWIPDIVDSFSSDGTVTLEIRADVEDVRKYTTSRLPQLPRFVSRDPELQDEIIEGIEKAVDGMFLLARLHLDSLIGKRSPKALRTTLAKLPSGSQAYDRAYRDAMARIGCQVSDQLELAKQALSWITCARGPLKTAELQHTLAIEIGETDFDTDNIPELEDIVSSCAGLITVDKESDIIRLVHYTTQEYFDRTKGEWFPNVEAELARACMTYLSYSCFDGLHMDDHIYTFERQIDGYPLYHYAGENWGHHVRNARLGTPEVVRFLQSNGAQASTMALLSRRRDRFSYRRRPYFEKPDEGPLIPGMHLAAYFGAAEALSALLPIHNAVDSLDRCGRTPLSWAAENGHLGTVIMLLDNGADADSKDSNHQTPLFWACKRGQEDVARLLLEHGADPESRSKSGRTPLSKAAANGHASIVQFLLEEAGAKAEPKDQDGETPLHRASWNGHSAVVQVICEVNSIDINSPNKRGTTPLMKACGWAGSEESVQILLQYGADIAARGRAGTTALFNAALNDDVRIVRLLLQSGADARLKDRFGMTPLDAAARYGQVTVVDFLVNRFKDEITDEIRMRYEGYKLEWAIEDNDMDVVDDLLNRGVDINVADDNGETPLHLSIKNGSVVVSKRLLDIGAALEARDKIGQTPLAYAMGSSLRIAEGPELVKMLLEKGADINTIDDEGRSLLAVAIRRPSLDMIKFLLDKGADVNARDLHGRTPPMMVHPSLISANEKFELLMSKGPDMDAQDNEGRTMLSHAASKSGGLGPDSCGILKRIIEKLPSLVNLEDHNGHSPLWHAMHKGVSYEVIRTLLEAGASMTSTAASSSFLCTAASNGWHHILQLFLKHGADPNGISDDGWTPLSVAASHEFKALVQTQVLVDGGADVNGRDKWNRTAMCRAAEQGNLEIVEFLFQCGGKVELQNKNRRAPLTLAAKGGHVAVVERLLREVNCDINSRDAFGRTALSHAVAQGHTDVATLLLKSHDIDIDTADYYGATPLSIAARQPCLRNCTKTTQLLLDTRKVNLTSKDSFGRTPLWWARWSGNQDVAELLVQQARQRGVILEKYVASSPPAVFKNKWGRLDSWCDICTLGLEADRDMVVYQCLRCQKEELCWCISTCKECFGAGVKCLGTTGSHVLTLKPLEDSTCDSEIGSQTDSSSMWDSD